MASFDSDFGYGFWCSQIAPIRGRGPDTQRQLFTELAFWSAGCAPGTAIQRVINANNCHARGSPLSVPSETIAKAYRELRNGGRLPRHSKREAFATALLNEGSTRRDP